MSINTATTRQSTTAGTATTDTETVLTESTEAIEDEMSTTAGITTTDTEITLIESTEATEDEMSTTTQSGDLILSHTTSTSTESSGENQGISGDDGTTDEALASRSLLLILISLTLCLIVVVCCLVVVVYKSEINRKHERKQRMKRLQSQSRIGIDINNTGVHANNYGELELEKLENENGKTDLRDDEKEDHESDNDVIDTMEPKTQKMAIKRYHIGNTHTQCTRLPGGVENLGEGYPEDVGDVDNALGVGRTGTNTDARDVEIIYSNDNHSGLENSKNLVDIDHNDHLKGVGVTETPKDNCNGRI